MSATKIQWTQQTWNPVRGCSRISPGCVNCYAERMAARFSAPGEPFHGFVKVRSQCSGFVYDNPRAAGSWTDPKWTGKVELIPHMVDIPLRTKKPTTWFVNSMSDLFHESLPHQDRRRVFDVMRAAPQHTYQILTKRASIMFDFMRWWVMQHVEQPPKNWWLGVSCEDQQRADERIPLLLQTPAAVRFVSAEPLLGPVELDRIPNPGFAEGQRWFHALKGYAWECNGEDYYDVCNVGTQLDWVIVGGESGPGARPCDLEWIRSIVRQCAAAGVPCFVKQLGARAFDGHSLHKQIHHRSTDGNLYLKFDDRKGGKPSEWPEDLRVREMPKEIRGKR